MSKFNFDKIIKEFESKKDDIALKVLEVSKKEFVNQYNSEQDPTHIRWKDVQRNIDPKKANKYTGQKILYNEGYLLAALNNSIRTGSDKWTDCKLVIDNEYAKYHQYGTKNIPQRKILGHNDTLEQLQLKVLQDEITKLFK